MKILLLGLGRANLPVARYLLDKGGEVFVYDENMEKLEGIDITRSIDVLRDMRGGSEEHTKLFTAMTRSIGIPTQINLGIVYKEGAFRYHSWPSVFTDGMWHDLDPFFGQDRADATHIALVRGDFEKLVELIRIMGVISINILDYR